MSLGLTTFLNEPSVKAKCTGRFMSYAYTVTEHKHKFKTK